MLCWCVEQTFQNISNCLGSAFCKRYGRKEVRRKFSGHCSPDYSTDLIWNDYYGLTIFHDIQKRWERVEWKRKFQECNFMILSRSNFYRCHKRITGQNEISFNSQLKWKMLAHLLKFNLVYRIIEEEKELRSRKAESSLWSEATGDSKVKPKKQWSDKQRARHQKIAITNKIILQVSLANSKAVFDLRVKPSKSALDQSSFPWQVDITLIMMINVEMVILLMILIMMMMVLVRMMKLFHIVCKQKEFSGRPVSDLFEDQVGRAFLFFPMGLTMSRW